MNVRLRLRLRRDGLRSLPGVENEDRGAFRMVSSVSFIHPRQLVETTVVKDREVTGRLVLDNGCPTSYLTDQNETGDTMLVPSLNPVAVPAVAADGLCRCT